LSDVKRAVHDHHARFLELAPFEETWPSQFDRSIKAAIPRAVREQADGEPLPIDADLAALYAGEIRYLDHHVGRLLEGLRERGELDGALVMVLSDHGETFHEHADYWNHGLAVYDTTVHVPWILWRSPELRVREEAGRTVDVPLSTVDVAPTLLALLDLERDEGLDGVSVLPAVRGERFERGPVYCEATQPLHRDAERGGWANRRKPRCLRSGPWKLVESPLHRTLELYDLDHDPGERQSLLETPEHAQRVEELLATLRGWTESGVPFPSRFLPAQQEDLRFRIMMMQRLQNSGYAGTGDESGDEPIEDAWGGGDGESR
jgi:arylsulfatase A-like enzyme